MDEAAKLGRKKEVLVLIVEDDKFLKDLISEKLKKEGYSVIEATDGAEGIKLLKEKHPTVVLLDLVIPETDGFEFLRIVGGDATVNSIPIIVLSNLGSKEDIEQARSLGAREFLVKANYTPAEIIAELNKNIEQVYI